MSSQWKAAAEKVLAEYARIRALVPPSARASDAVWAAWTATVLSVDLATYRHAKGSRALAWTHVDRWRRRGVSLQRPEQVEVHFAVSLLYLRKKLALETLFFLLHQYVQV